MPDREQENVRYRVAVQTALLLAGLAGLLLIGHWAFGILSTKAARVMAFGIFFFLFIAAGYRADLAERRQADAEARKANRPASEKQAGH